MSADKYKEGDRVFAKLKGYQAWPALIKSRIPGKSEGYNVYFYGTYESAKVKPESIYPYNEDTKARYGKAQRKTAATFKVALDEIENNVEIKSADEFPTDQELLPAAIEPPSEEPMGEDDGELVIDEGPPPPLLKKEGKIPTPTLKKAPAKAKAAPKESKPAPILAADGGAELNESVAAPTPSHPPPKHARRGSKATKRDSISSLNPATPPEPVTPAAPQPEIVSRSGRKIKPKRFADDEGFGPPGGGRGSEEGKSGEATPAKRAKRQSSAGNKGTPSPAPTPLVLQTAPTLQPEAPNQENKPDPKSLPPLPTLERPVATSRRGANKKKAVVGAGTATVAAAAPKKSIANTSTGLPALAPTRPPPPLIRIMPTLIPAPSSPTLVILPADTESEPAPSKPEKNLPTSETKSNLDEVELKQELSIPASPDTRKFERTEMDEEGTEKENNLRDEALGGFDNGVPEDYTDETATIPKRMKVELKSGSGSVVLSFNHERPHFYRNDVASIDYDIATARSVLQTKTQLEVNETAFLKTVADSIDTKDVKEKEKKKQLGDLRSRTDQIQRKVMQLRMEGEIVEIIGELVGCLGMKSSNADRALELLERLGSRADINPLALKKNSEVVDVIRRVQNYHGNPNEWNLPQAQLEEFHVKAEMIREKASSIYQSFKQLFISNAAKPFYDTFNEEKQKFNAAVEGVPQTTILGLVDDPTVTVVKKEEDDHHKDGEKKDAVAAFTNGNTTLDDSSSPMEISGTEVEG